MIVYDTPTPLQTTEISGPLTIVIGLAWPYLLSENPRTTRIRAFPIRTGVLTQIVRGYGGPAESFPELFRNQTGIDSRRREIRFQIKIGNRRGLQAEASGNGLCNPGDQHFPIMLKGNSLAFSTSSRGVFLAGKSMFDNV